MQEIFNSPWAVIFILLSVAGVLWYRNYSGADRTCTECGKGTMEETSAQPEGFVDGHSSSTGGSATVNMTVTYICSACRARLVRTERR